MPPPPTTITATPSSETPRPILKLATSRKSSFSADLLTPSSEKKTIRIKVNTSQPGTPAAAVPPVPVKVSKAGRSSKPTEKLIAAKRALESDDDEDENAPLAGRRISKIKVSQLPAKKVYNIQTPTGRLTLKARGKPVEHKPGEAWDSEASDREEDPVREAAMILRTYPGTSTEYLNKALEEGKIGLDKKLGGADLSIDWLDAKERRAMVTIDGHHFAAVLVDLPTIVEAMKTWDKKNFMKNMDITQMLLCFAEVNNDQEAKTVALPNMVQQTEYKWPHGMTPPMHDAINRRFRKQPSEKQLMSTAAQVKRLLAEDATCVEPPKYEFLQDEFDGFDESGDEDAEGEEVDDYFGGAEYGDEIAQGAEDDDDDNADLEAELEAELAGVDFEMDMDDARGATPTTQLEAHTPMTMEATTPAPGVAEISDADGEDEEISEEDDDDDADDSDLDEEEAAKQGELREAKHEMHSMQKKVADLKSQMAAQTNSLIRNRMHQNIQNLEKEIQLRKAQLNITDDE
ncbi:TAFII55 protein conserved region-domain-containing protein [Truncatella angustata]|uniref:TAFII55 protein conserved region-domain-containing protein n=1 Tax=Truncatella angustata TaxID=152316 RepID=A0A9P8UY09_9PEZI|nr:TAFII55 protein conserved region-domain-containing protein [Truncatella angustata]KAH6660014.1 TAFII55 protein conserved region-domain-containing protein [Truncatella angustata]